MPTYTTKELIDIIPKLMERALRISTKYIELTQSNNAANTTSSSSSNNIPKSSSKILLLANTQKLQGLITLREQIQEILRDIYEHEKQVQKKIEKYKKFDNKKNQALIEQLTALLNSQLHTCKNDVCKIYKICFNESPPSSPSIDINEGSDPASPNESPNTSKSDPIISTRKSPRIRVSPRLGQSQTLEIPTNTSPRSESPRTDYSGVSSFESSPTISPRSLDASPRKSPLRVRIFEPRDNDYSNTTINGFEEAIFLLEFADSRHFANYLNPSHRPDLNSLERIYNTAAYPNIDVSFHAFAGESGKTKVGFAHSFKNKIQNRINYGSLKNKFAELDESTRINVLNRLTQDIHATATKHYPEATYHFCTMIVVSDKIYHINVGKNLALIAKTAHQRTDDDSFTPANFELNRIKKKNNHGSLFRYNPAKNTASADITTHDLVLTEKSRAILLLAHDEKSQITSDVIYESLRDKALCAPEVIAKSLTQVACENDASGECSITSLVIRDYEIEHFIAEQNAVYMTIFSGQASPILAKDFHNILNNAIENEHKHKATVMAKK